MKKRYEIHVLNAAEKDIDLAFDYYTSINPKHGKRFIKLLSSAFDDLTKNPFYQIRYDNFRIKIVRKFPYAIHYITDEERQIVRVYGVRCTYQSPASYPKE